MYTPTNEAARIEAGGSQLHFLGAHAKGSIKGFLLEMQLEQKFRNPSKRNVEVTYTCPLPWGSVLLGVDVVLNGQSLQGKVVEKTKARETYEDALQEGNSSILVGCNPDGSVSMELGNLLAQEECSITLRYAQVLQVQQGSIRCMLPTTIAPRYGDAVKEGGFELHTAPLDSALVEYTFTVELEIEGELAHAEISCPSHCVNMRLKSGKMLISLGEQAWLDRDFIVLLQDLPSSSQASWSTDLLEPAKSVVVATLCALQDGHQQELFVRGVRAQILIDCSGSMAGSSMTSAQNAVRSIIEMLDERDAFTVGRFGSRVEHCHSRLVPALMSEKQQAREWAVRLQADMGGTEMQAAIRSTLELADTHGSDLLLVTDGEIHGIDSLLSSVRRRAHRIFIVGIGSSPAEAHLRRLAAVTGGACEFVAPGEAVEPAILRMFRRLRSPAVTKLRLHVPEELEQWHPENLPTSCFVADQITTFIRFDGAWPEGQKLELLGCVDGAQQETVLAQCHPVQVDDHRNTAARLHAHAVCARLKDSKQPGLLRERQELAVQYQIITDATHFVLVHERAAQDKPEDMPILLRTPSMQPENLKYSRRRGAANTVQSFACSAMPTPMGTDISIPSVWRTNRADAAKRVDALSRGLHDADVEIPDFLRKAASPMADLDGSPQSFVDIVKKKRPHSRPRSYAQLRDLNVPEQVVAWLEKLGQGAKQEAQTVELAVELVLQLARKNWQSDQELLAYAQQTQPQLLKLLTATAHAWPNFTEA